MKTIKPNKLEIKRRIDFEWMSSWWKSSAFWVCSSLIWEINFGSITKINSKLAILLNAKPICSKEALNSGKIDALMTGIDTPSVLKIKG